MKLYPLKFHPIYMDRVWGGKNLSKILHRTLPSAKVGESWELCANKEGTSIVANGCYAGMSLPELIEKHCRDIMGSNRLDRFPLLIKYLDANDTLSVQVHPDDQYALANEGDLGKTELWYILAAEPGAKLVFGLKEGTTAQSFKTAIAENRVPETLNEVEVRPGDVLFIPAGTVHATGAGIVLAEIQQNSNTTYRVYDWDRVGLDGRPRELHIQRALEVIDYNQPVPALSPGLTTAGDGYRSKLFVHCPHFSVEELDIRERYQWEGDRFEILMGIQGRLSIRYKEGLESIGLGDTVLIPAALGQYSLEGQGKVLKTYIAERDEI